MERRDRIRDDGAQSLRHRERHNITDDAVLCRAFLVMLQDFAGACCGPFASAGKTEVIRRREVFYDRKNQLGRKVKK